MEKRMGEGISSTSMVDYATNFDRPLKELRDLSSQLYHAADYCKTAFLTSQDKTLIVEATKEYISRALVIVVDHLGSVSSNLEYCISKSNSVPETQQLIDSLKQRIGACQHYSYKLALPRFHWSAQFSRYHCRYISLPIPLKDSTIMNAVSSYPESCIDAKGEEGTPFETKQLKYLNTCKCKSSLVKSSIIDIEKMNALLPPLNTTRDHKHLLPVEDGLSALPKAEQSRFQFQEAQKLKRGTMNWKLMQNKDIESLIKRTKRILT